MIKVGISGGVGCGKSTVARLMEGHGFRRLDSDQIVRDQVLRSPAVLTQLRLRYGTAVIDPSGEVHRPKLAQRVFSSNTEREWLENLTHPLVYTAWKAAFAATPRARWVIEVPLLFEKQLENWFDFTVCVALSSAQQLVRLEQRGLSLELARQRISVQLPLARKIELSDTVLWNDGSKSVLEAQVDCLTRALAAR